jgi:hypothetical protein
VPILGFNEPKNITEGDLSIVEDENFGGYKLGIDEGGSNLDDLDLGIIPEASSESEEDAYYNSLTEGL